MMMKLLAAVLSLPLATTTAFAPQLPSSHQRLLRPQAKKKKSRFGVLPNQNHRQHVIATSAAATQRTMASTATAGRAIAKIVPGKTAANGMLTRLIGSVDMDGAGTLHDELPEIDPFILLDMGHIPKNDLPPFGAHPHRGHSVVTISLQGSVWAWDAFGQEKLVLQAPASYWVDAGSGVFHDERSIVKDEKDPLQHWRFFQLWVGVRDEDRQKPPRVQSDDALPAFDLLDDKGMKIGQGRHYVGPDTKIQTPHPISVAHIQRQEPGTTYRHPIAHKDHGGFVVHMAGQAAYGRNGMQPTQERDVLVLGHDDDDDEAQQPQEESDASSSYLPITTLPDGDGAEYLICTGERNQEPWVKKLVANGALICANEEEARALAPKVEAMSKKGQGSEDEESSFAPFGR